MARLKIEMPEQILANIKIAVRITDINYGNHLGNDRMVGLIHEARIQWLNAAGFSEINLGGAGSIMSDLQIEYKRQVFYGDVLDFQIGIGEISSVHFEMYYQISNQRQEEVAVAKTGIVCFNYDKNKVCPIPEAFKKLILP